MLESGILREHSNICFMIIFISGSINSGKSTIAKLLSEKIINSALIEVDSLCEFIDWMPIEQAVPINLQNAVSVIKNFSQHKIHAIVPYPLSQKNYDFMLSQLGEMKENIFTFILNSKLEKVLSNRGARELTDWEKERIEHHYKIGINNPGFGIVIDNTNQTPEETASFIFNSIREVLIV